MDKEEAIEIIRKELLCVDRDTCKREECKSCDLVMPSKEPIIKAYQMAIEALEQEPCEDCVSRKRIKQIIGNIVAEYDTETIHVDRLIDEIDDLPPVTPTSKKGHWISIYGNVKCSVCGNVKDSRYVGKATHYCDFCGARME